MRSIKIIMILLLFILGFWKIECSLKKFKCIHDKIKNNI
jgi:hypothetical protein